MAEIRHLENRYDDTLVVTSETVRKYFRHSQG